MPSVGLNLSNHDESCDRGPVALRALAFHFHSAKLAPLKNLLRFLLLESRYLPAIGAGLALAAAFPGIGLPGAAWIAPALMLACAHGRNGGEVFRIGFVAGLAGWLAQLQWLLRIPAVGYPILGWLALSAFLALYHAAWVWLVVRLNQCGSRDMPTWVQRTIWALAGAAAWVASEMIRARLLTGFPWNFIGASQFRITPLIQIASVTGVYGVSFAVVWMSLALFNAVRELLRRPTQRHAWLGELLLPGATIICLLVFGFARLREPAGAAEMLRVTFIQPSIPQKMIWASGEDSSWFQRVLDLSQNAMTNDTDLVLWPEAAVPKMIRYDDDVRAVITGFARSNAIWMIIGSDDAEPARRPTKSDDTDYFNASFLINPKGEIVERYCKRNLVIFGEYIPLVRWLPFVKWFTPITGGFTPGDRVTQFEMERRSPTWRASTGDERRAGPETGAPIRTAVLICFEDMFPHLAREYVGPDTQFLVNLTNDGWFGEGAEQWQHAGGAVFRAVENDVPLLRCCNNGLTCWVDSRGRVQQIFRDKAGGIHGAGVMTEPIPVRPPGETHPGTFYNRHGDWFGWACVIVTGMMVLGEWFRRRRIVAGTWQPAQCIARSVPQPEEPGCAGKNICVRA